MFKRTTDVSAVVWRFGLNLCSALGAIVLAMFYLRNYPFTEVYVVLYGKKLRWWSCLQCYPLVHDVIAPLLFLFCPRDVILRMTGLCCCRNFDATQARISPRFAHTMQDVTIIFEILLSASCWGLNYSPLLFFRIHHANNGSAISEQFGTFKFFPATLATQHSKNHSGEGDRFREHHSLFFSKISKPCCRKTPEE